MKLPVTPEPNRILIGLIISLLGFWIVAMVVPTEVLRNVFSATAFSVAFMVVITWFSAAMKAMRDGSAEPAWRLVIGIFGIFLWVYLNRSYVAIYNQVPKEWQDWLRETPISAWWSFGFTLFGMFFLQAPSAQEHGMGMRSWVTSLIAIVIGTFAAGVIIGMSLNVG